MSRRRRCSVCVVSTRTRSQWRSSTSIASTLSTSSTDHMQVTHLTSHVHWTWNWFIHWFTGRLSDVNYVHSVSFPSFAFTPRRFTREHNNVSRMWQWEVWMRWSGGSEQWLCLSVDAAEQWTVTGELSATHAAILQPLDARVVYEIKLTAKSSESDEYVTSATRHFNVAAQPGHTHSPIAGIKCPMNFILMEILHGNVSSSISVLRRTVI